MQGSCCYSQLSPLLVDTAPVSGTSCRESCTGPLVPCGPASHLSALTLQVVVVTAPMCWGITLTSHLVVIMGTQYSDAAHSQGSNDYPVTDLLQMMGRTSRPDVDDSGK